MDGSLWLDVTTLLGWGRPAVGIVRMETACAAHFLDAGGANIRFCRFDTRQHAYFEVLPQVVRQALAGLHTSQPEALAVDPLANTTERRMRNALSRLVGLLPRRIGSRLWSYAAARKEAYRAAARSYHDARLAFETLLPAALRPKPAGAERRSVAPDPSVQAPFARGDVYVSLGLDWDTKDYPYLYALKKELGLRVVLICYDIIPVKFEQLYFSKAASRFGQHFADLAWTADEVLCISECTRRDLTELLRELGVPLPPMSVVPLGCELPAVLAGEPSDAVREILQHRFILFVSTIERRKNHEVLYRAYTRLVDEGRTDLPLLVFVGMPGWGVAELMSDLQLDVRIRPYVRLLHEVSDFDLKSLYEKSAFTVFPSLYEGWGLPVAESLAHGKFCLASSAASIPEVGGDLIEYLDPWDLPAWKSRLAWYIDHPEDVARHEQRIRQEFRPVPWSDTAAFVLAAAERLAA